MTTTGQWAPPKHWNPASYLTDIKATDNLQVADWVSRFLLYRKVRRSMTNGQYITFCASHEPIR